ALYQEVLYGRLPPAEARTSHRSIAERLDALHATRAAEAASELALHFDAAGEFGRAASCYATAAEVALGKRAHGEALRQIERGLRLAALEAPGSSRSEHELRLRLLQGTALTGMRGFADGEVEGAFRRALELIGESPDTPRLVPAMLGLHRYYA